MRVVVGEDVGASRNGREMVERAYINVYVLRTYSMCAKEKEGGWMRSCSIKRQWPGQVVGRHGSFPTVHKSINNGRSILHCRDGKGMILAYRVQIGMVALEDFGIPGRSDKLVQTGLVSKGFNHDGGIAMMMTSMDDGRMEKNVGQATV